MKSLEKTGLAHVGLAHDGDFNDIVFFLVTVILGNIFQHPVQQIAGAVARVFARRVVEAFERVDGAEVEREVEGRSVGWG